MLSNCAGSRQKATVWLKAHVLDAAQFHQTYLFPTAMTRAAKLLRQIVGRDAHAVFIGDDCQIGFGAESGFESGANNEMVVNDQDANGLLADLQAPPPG